MTHLGAETVFRISTAPLDEKSDAIEDPLQAELERMIGVGNSLVVLAGGRADPRRTDGLDYLWRPVRRVEDGDQMLGRLWQDRVASSSP